MSDVAGWAIRLLPGNALACGKLRLRGSIDVCHDEATNMLWLRGPKASDELSQELRKLAIDGIFNVVANGSLLRIGSRLAVESLPAEGWLPLDRFLKLGAQPNASAAKPFLRIPLRLVRSQEERAPTVLTTNVESWASYAQGAAAVRLSVLKMAAAEDGRVAVRGTTLPPIRGLRFAETSGIAVPCGWSIRPQADASVLASLLELSEGDLALFREDGSYELISARYFTTCTRAVSRQTVAERTQ